MDDDEDGDEYSGLLKPTKRTKRNTVDIFALWRWLIVCLLCVTTAFTLRALIYRDSHKPTLDAKAVQQLEVALHKQREQLQQLQSHLAQSAMSTGGCVDRWGVQYPLELDMWDGHSCSWKKKWGQCGEFATQCERTCGSCTSPTSGGSSGGRAPALPSTTPTVAPVVRSAVEQPVPQPDISVDTDPDPDDELPPLSGAKSPRPVAEPRLSPEADAGVATAAEIMPAVVARDTTRLNDPGFVGGARTQADVLRSVMRHRRPSGEPASKPSREAQAGYRYGDDSSSATTASPGIDDSYEGPQSSKAPSQGAPTASRSEETMTTRARYVAGDEAGVISSGSECGIPIGEPAVSADFALAAFQATPSAGPKGRHYSSVTYLSSVVALQAGEVSHIRQSVRLPRPEGAVGIAHYAVEIMQQAASEVRPATEGTVHLRRLALQPSNAPLGTRARSSCQWQPPVMAGAGRRLTEVRFPHPYVVTPNASDVWMIELHLIRTEGLSVPTLQAQQCVCMREDIGSVNCCPHSCRFPTSRRNRVEPASYRISVVLTWLLADHDETGGGRRAALRPLSAVWVPVGGDGAAYSAPQRLPRSCRRGVSAPSTEFDAAACNAKTGSRCDSSRYGPWLQLDVSLLAVSALAMGSPRVRSLALVSAKKEGDQHKLCKARGAPGEAPCSLQALSPTSRVQAHAELDISSEPARGADAGYVMWVSRRR